MQAHPTAPNSPSWKIGLCEIGDCYSCVYSWCCFPYALAESKAKMDGSDTLWNLACLGFPATRYLIRDGYQIEGTACDDCWKSCLCICCSANQVYQEVNARGKVTSREHVGRLYNTRDYSPEAKDHMCSCQECLQVSFCSCCLAADILKAEIGMDWCFACCCVGICAASVIQRYQYHIKGDDVGSDYVVPVALAGLAYGTYGIGLLCLAPFLITKYAKMKREEEANQKNFVLPAKKFYLNPLQPSQTGQAGVLIQMGHVVKTGN